MLLGLRFWFSKSKVSPSWSERDNQFHSLVKESMAHIVSLVPERKYPQALYVTLLCKGTKSYARNRILLIGSLAQPRLQVRETLGRSFLNQTTTNMSNYNYQNVYMSSYNCQEPQNILFGSFHEKNLNLNLPSMLAILFYLKKKKSQIAIINSYIQTYINLMSRSKNALCKNNSRFNKNI